MTDCYRFDHFELRQTERLLYVDGEPASLGLRAVNLLFALVERHGRLVPKHELLDLVWPGVVVEENNLQVQISSLRKLLGANAIATIPGRGYRFTRPLIGAHLASPLAAESTAACLAPDKLAVPLPPIGASALSPLPQPASRLLGRARDLAALNDWRSSPLINIVGAGGIGKTLLALTAAHAWRRHFFDGAVWVELAGLSDPALVAPVVAQALGLPSGGAQALPQLVAGLSSLQLLLVIDNAEHLLPAVAEMAQSIIAGAPQVHLLVTSQVPLKVEGERVFRLNALSVPAEGTPVADALAHGAVALFADQAQAADRRFEVTQDNVDLVIVLCRRLDGVALAIKLAAARVSLFGLQGTHERLDERFRLLGAGPALAPARQQTLRGALDWSHDLLSPAEQAVFRRLSVLAGGFTLNLASAIAGDDTLDAWAVIDTLGALVDRSLVAADALADGADVPRYRLFESTRDYACQKLRDAGEIAPCRRRHAQAVAALMDEAYEAYWRTPDVTWLETYGHEIDNVRAALDWSVVNDLTLGVKLIGAASVLFLLLGLAPECRQRGLVLEAPAMAWTSPATARYWLERSRLHWGVSNLQMHDMACRAAEQSRVVNDGRALYLALRCVAGSGVPPLAQSRAMLDEMADLEKTEWPERLRLQRLLAELTVLKSSGQMGRAHQVCEHLLARARMAGLDAVVSAALADLAVVSLAVRDAAGAVRTCRELLARGRLRRDNFVLHALAIVASASFMQGDLAQAREALVDFVAASRSREWEWFGLYSALFALLAAKEGRWTVAARVLAYADHALVKLGSRDLHALQAWTQAASLVNQALDATTIAQLGVEGVGLDPETISALTLGTRQT